MPPLTSEVHVIGSRKKAKSDKKLDELPKSKPIRRRLIKEVFLSEPFIGCHQKEITFRKPLPFPDSIRRVKKEKMEKKHTKVQSLTPDDGVMCDWTFSQNFFDKREVFSAVHCECSGKSSLLYKLFFHSFLRFLPFLLWNFSSLDTISLQVCLVLRVSICYVDVFIWHYTKISSLPTRWNVKKYSKNNVIAFSIMFNNFPSYKICSTIRYTFKRWM